MYLLYDYEGNNNLLISKFIREIAIDWKQKLLLLIYQEFHILHSSMGFESIRNMGSIYYTYLSIDCK